MNKLKGGAIFVRPSYSFLNLASGPTTNSKQTMQTEKVSFRPRASRIILD